MSINVAIKYGLDMTGATDNADKLAQMAADVRTLWLAKKPLPRLVFPEGDVSFSAFPNLAYDNLQIVADGECNLRHTGTGDAIVFDSSVTNPLTNPSINPASYQPAINNLLFEGFTVWPTFNSGDGVVFTGIHRSKLSVNVQGSPPNGTVDNMQAAIRLNFCIVTELHPIVGSCAGHQVALVIDIWGTRTDLESTACRIVRPCLESCAIGAYIKQGGYINFYDGTIEACGTGIQIDNGGNNHFCGVEMESNNKDIICSSSTHDNLFWRCGQGSAFQLKTNGAFPGTLPGYNNCIDNGALTGLFGL